MNAAQTTNSGTESDEGAGEIASVDRHSKNRALIPSSAKRESWEQLWPKDRISRASVIVLGTLLLVYAVLWIDGHRDLLFDPLLQPDDVRSCLFPYHQYGSAGTLGDDPHNDMARALMPPLVHGLYRLIVPLADVAPTTKIAQAVTIGMVLFAGFFAVRHRGGGPAAGILLLFLFLHTPVMVNRMAGGLARAFGFPLMILWGAGAMTRSGKIRFFSVVMGAVTYPSAWLILLAAEGVYCFRNGRERFAEHLKKYTVLIVVSFAALTPYMLSKSDLGRVYKLEEARNDPVFQRDGRVPVLPFQPLLIEFKVNLVAAFSPSGMTIVPAVGEWTSKWGSFLAVALLLVFATAGLFGTTRFPAAAVSIGIGAVVLYFLARALAFRLYMPERFLAYGLPAACVLLPIEVIAGMQNETRRLTAFAVKNFLAAGLIAFVLGFIGDGIVPDNGLAISRHFGREFYDFVGQLPPDTLIAAHPEDGGDIPFWSARATMENRETHQCWFRNYWQRSKRRTEDTLAAVFATDRQAVIDFVGKYGVTHFLLKDDRYWPTYKDNITLYEPFGSHLRDLLAGVDPAGLVFADVPSSAVIYRWRRYTLVDVERLRSGWGETPDGR